MEEINIYTSDGMSINALVQWDKNIYVYFFDNEFEDAYNVHFFTNEMEEDFIVESTLEDNILRVKVPDDLIAKGKPIMAYICIYEGEMYKNAFYFKLPVRKRPKPSNYIYTGSSDYIIIQTLIDRCEFFKNQAEESANISLSLKTNGVNV